MRKILILALVFLCLSAKNDLLAVDIDEDEQYVIIKTSKLKLFWNKAAQMGYREAYVGDSKESVIAPGGSVFFHSSFYGYNGIENFYDWGELKEHEVILNENGKAVIRYRSNDGASKDYTCVATYWDSVQYIRHELTVTNTGDAVVLSFWRDKTPEWTTNQPVKGMKNFTSPFPHVAYWDGSFFAALYGPDAEKGLVKAHQGRPFGRMALKYDNLGKELKKDESQTITYYVAFGEGGEAEATALANQVTKLPPGEAVDPKQKLASTWGNIKIQL